MDLLCRLEFNLLTKLCNISQGFYYDAYYVNLTLNEEHFKGIETRASGVVKVCSLIYLDSVAKHSYEILPDILWHLTGKTII
jgi:hypothetical protein